MSGISGRCLCGAIHYESDADPVMSAACHCTHCRRQTGTAFSVIVAVPADSLVVNGDTLRVYDDIGTSGLPVLRKFCGNCGSPLFTDVKAYEDLVFIKAGTLDDPENIQVGAEIWCDSKLSWSSLADDVPKFPGNPPPA